MFRLILATAVFLALAGTAAAAKPNETRRMFVTAYTSCDANIARVKRCDGITASGRVARWGIAACGRAFAFGTVFEVADLGLFACYDRGGGVTNDLLDIWIPPGKSIGGARWRAVTIRYDVDPLAVLDESVISEVAPGEAATREDVDDLPAPAQQDEAPTLRMADSQAVGTLKVAATRSNGDESTLGNLIADMLRTQYNADVGLIHSGALSANLPTGEVRAGHMLAVVGPSQKPLKLDMRGEQIKRVIEHGLTLDPGSEGWLSLSGLRLVYNPNAPEGHRIVELVHTASNQPVWDGQYYHVVLTDSLYFAEGYTPLFEVGRGLFTYEPLVNMASRWLAQHGVFTPKLEGRVKAAP
ncbi:MAG: 5'-nucleotidase C-terminal domain-containing protein [Anaerolineae bacterium]|nr:5'-nucleotidase C-terminal domain-containing protein [Anaerolineae bacterium]